MQQIEVPKYFQGQPKETSNSYQNTKIFTQLSLK